MKEKTISEKLEKLQNTMSESGKNESLKESLKKVSEGIRMVIEK